MCLCRQTLGTGTTPFVSVFAACSTVPKPEHLLGQCFLNEHVYFQGCSSRWVDELPPVPVARSPAVRASAALLVLEGEELLPKL